MVNPQSVLDAFRPGDIAWTKSNGLSDESGKVCFSAKAKMCMQSGTGLTEFVGAAGRSIRFTNYQKFKGGERVARLLTWKVDAGDSWQAQVNTLGELIKYDDAAFRIQSQTPKENQIRSSVVPEAELRGLTQQPLEIIWPQVLDGNSSGQTSYYVSVDRLGNIREVLPLSVSVERADDSARRQLMKWKFQPVLRNGAPVQAECILNFNFNTREFGPSSLLTDEEVRKLASNIVEPVFPEGTAPSGSIFSIRIAVDDEGYVIESMAGDGPHEMYRPCSDAVAKWHFSPILEDGKPRPYRAEIKCKMP
jgi:Gram-negative bacterial TonB protein C-terminal